MNALRNALLLATPLALAGLARADDPDEWKDRRPKCPIQKWNAMEGKPAPSLAGLKQWHNTAPLDWAALRGNVVLIDAWGTWCPPCVKGIPHLVELHEKFADKGLVVLGVHSQKGHKRLEKFVEDRALPYAVAADETNAFSAAMSVAFYPTYYIVDRNGTMRVAGVNKTTDANGKPLFMDLAIETILAEPWEGERKKIEFKERAKKQDVADAKEPAPRTPPKASPALRLGPDGWPIHVQKNLYAKNDYRGKQAPPFAVESWLTKEPSREGKVVLIDFWATWCGPCVAGMPHMQEYQEEFGDDLVVIGISDQHPEALNARTEQPWGPVVERFLAGKPYTYAQALDGEARMKSALGVQGIPHVMLIGSDNVVRWQGFPGDQKDPLHEGLIAKIIEMDKKRVEQEKQKKGSNK